MTKLNKITSVLLSAIMVIGIFSIIPFAAGAETSGNLFCILNLVKAMFC